MGPGAIVALQGGTAIGSLQLPHQPATVGQPVRLALKPEYLAGREELLAAYPQGWLLVFDNAPDRASVREFLPLAGPGRVLITSQSAVWPPGQAVEVPVLGTEVAAVFLVSRAGDPDSQSAAGAKTSGSG